MRYQLIMNGLIFALMTYHAIKSGGKSGEEELVPEENISETQLKPYVAKTGIEFKAHLESLQEIPKGVEYDGPVYRSVSKQNEAEYNVKPDDITQYSIDKAWGRYDKKGEAALYFSQTIDGNKTEITFYGDWENYSTYEYDNTHFENLLDLTDSQVLSQLEVGNSELTRNITLPDEELAKTYNYEFTNEIGSWARTKGYKGLIVPGARGEQNYKNVVLFDQQTINSGLGGKSPVNIQKP